MGFKLYWPSFSGQRGPVTLHTNKVTQWYLSQESIDKARVNQNTKIQTILKFINILQLNTR